MWTFGGTNSRWSARWRAASLVSGAVVLTSVVLGFTTGTIRLGTATLTVLSWLPADPRCGHPVGQLAALARNEGLPIEACLADLANTPFVPPLLVRLARDGARPLPVRASALAALTAAGVGPPGLVEALVVTPNASPALRQAAWEVAMLGRDEADWVERGSEVAVHGLYDRAAGRAFAAGEPGSTFGAARALGAGPVGAPDPGLLHDVYVGLGVSPAQLAEAVQRRAAGQMPLRLPQEWANAFWHHGCEDACVPLLVELLGVEADRRGEEAEPPAAAVPGADAAIDALYTDGETADHVREELGAVARWIARVPEPRRADRLISAVLHREATAPGAAEALAEAGDVHAVLVRGGSTPGATALAATDLALAARVPLAAWATERGVALQVGGHLYRVDACAAAQPADRPGEGWREVPTGGVDALALVEGAGRALRAGDVLSARAQVDAARGVWADAPGLGGLTASVLAYGGAEGWSHGLGGVLEAPAGTPPPEVAPAPRAEAPPARRGSRRRGRGSADVPPAPEDASVQGRSVEARLVRTAEGLLGVPGPQVLFVSRPGLPAPPRGRRPAILPLELRATARAAVLERLEQIRALTDDPQDRVRAAWWAARAGDTELARRLLAGLPVEPVLGSSLTEVLRQAVARAVGEPAPPLGTGGSSPGAAAAAPSGASPGTAPAAGGASPGAMTVAPADAESPGAATPNLAEPAPPCPAPFRAEPPLWAWSGASPTDR